MTTETTQQILEKNDGLRLHPVHNYSERKRIETILQNNLGPFDEREARTHTFEQGEESRFKLTKVTNLEGNSGYVISENNWTEGHRMGIIETQHLMLAERKYAYRKFEDEDKHIAGFAWRKY